MKTALFTIILLAFLNIKVNAQNSNLNDTTEWCYSGHQAGWLQNDKIVGAYDLYVNKRLSCKYKDFGKLVYTIVDKNDSISAFIHVIFIQPQGNNYIFNGSFGYDYIGAQPAEDDLIKIKSEKDRAKHQIKRFGLKSLNFSSNYTGWGKELPLKYERFASEPLFFYNKWIKLN